MLAYDRAVNETMLASLQELPSASDKAMAIMSHIVETEFLWYHRIQGRYDHIRSVWSGWSAVDMAAKLVELYDLWTQWLDRLGPHDLGRTVHYRNTKGVAYDNTVHDILVHVINHSTHHRGQVALEIRRLGVTPPLTDYIAYARKEI